MGWPRSVDHTARGPQVCKSKWTQRWGGRRHLPRVNICRQELGLCHCESPSWGAVGCGSWAPVKGVVRVLLIVYCPEESFPGFLDSQIVCFFVSCLSCNLAKKPLHYLCALTHSRCAKNVVADVGDWGCTLCMSADLLFDDAEPTTCRKHHQPLFSPLPPWASLLPAVLPPSSYWTGNLPGRVEGHTVTPQNSLWKSLKPQVLHRNLKDSYLKPLRLKKETGHISGFLGVT